MKMYKMYWFVITMFVFSKGFSQTNIEKIKELVPELDARIQAFKAEKNLPSVAYGLVVDGKIIYKYSIGITDYNTNKQADDQSVYRIASMSKSFASVAILQLRDAGRLKLDNPVSMYIPEIKGQKYSNDSPEITIRHLLTHAAGFPEDNPWGDRQLDISEAKMLAMFKKGISFSNEPGIAYEYSNMGFAMLGYIIKKVSGQPYQTYIANNIWKPLGMNNTYWEYSKVPNSQLVKGYRYLKNEQIEQPLEHDGAYGIMGGMLTTIDDFAKYMSFHLATYEVGSVSSKVLKKSSVKEIHQPWNFNSFDTKAMSYLGINCPTVSAYGYGIRWGKDCEQKITIGHTGGLPGFGSNWKVLPDYGIGIVTFANGTYAPTSAINGQLLDLIIEKTGIKPRKFPVSDILKQRQSQLLALLPSWQNAEKAGVFAENFFLDYFLEMLKTEAEPIFAKAGKVLKVNEIIAENALRGTFLVECENKNIEISFTLSPEKPALIQEYHIN
jgi:CubicO group peptidase (beta-lactamase class C family)